MFRTIFSSLLIFTFSFQPGLVKSQSYHKIHERALVVDTHNDVLSSASMKGMLLDVDLRGKSQSDLNRFKKGGVDVEVFSIFCDETYSKGKAYRYANREIDSLYAVAARNPNKMQIVYTPNQLLNTVKSRKLAAMMGVEGGHMIEDKIEYLDSLFTRGVRYMTLTWNNSTSWASSAYDETLHPDSLSHKGLNDLGKKIVNEMNFLGMIVDLSHVGEKTFYDAIQVSVKPIICSHSSVYNICPVFRNLKDDQIRAVGKNNGVIQVNFYSGFLDSSYSKKITLFYKEHKKENDSLLNQKMSPFQISLAFSKKYSSEFDSFRPPISLLIDHIDYIVKLIGVDHVGLGSDFDGIESSPKGLDDVSDFPKITKALLERGYSEKDIDKILGGNFLRVFKANSKDN